ncbi:MAG TPA: hypothetical protein EYQ61_04280 [Dehalococcoidia bacterium]|nr:hypothetical protein [Dehalococcoidia bacterium]
MIGLTVAALASVAVLLYISIERDFLPGIVELSVALGVVLIFGMVSLVPQQSQLAMQRRMRRIGVSRIRFVAVGVAILVLTAVLAFYFESFPWLAPLLLIVVMMLFATREADDEK